MKGKLLDYEQIADLVFQQVKKIIFPEEWLDLDLALSKQDLFTLLLVDRRSELIMSTATGIVDRLVKNDLLKRSRSETDRRIVMIKLTDKAKGLVEEIKSMGARYISLISEALTDEEREVMFRIVTKIIAVINEQGQSAQGAEKSENTVKKIQIE